MPSTCRTLQRRGPIPAPTAAVPVNTAARSKGQVPRHRQSPAHWAIGKGPQHAVDGQAVGRCGVASEVLGFLSTGLGLHRAARPRMNEAPLKVRRAWRRVVEARDSVVSRCAIALASSSSGGCHALKVRQIDVSAVICGGLSSHALSRSVRGITGPMSIAAAQVAGMRHRLSMRGNELLPACRARWVFACRRLRGAVGRTGWAGVVRAVVDVPGAVVKHRAPRLRAPPAAGPRVDGELERDASGHLAGCRERSEAVTRSSRILLAPLTH